MYCAEGRSWLNSHPLTSTKSTQMHKKCEVLLPMVLKCHCRLTNVVKPYPAGKPAVSVAIQTGRGRRDVRRRAAIAGERRKGAGPVAPRGRDSIVCGFFCGKCA